MNNNFTRKELKNFTSKVSDFLSILTGLPAGPGFAVNFLLAPYNNLLRLPAISTFLKGNDPELKLKPVFVVNVSCNFKKAG
jgi:hypothetical protein